MPNRHTIWITVVLLSAGTPADGAPTVELVLDGAAHQGRALAHDRQICWLLERNGALHRIPLQEVSSFRKVSGEFRPATTVELRDELRRQYGQRYEIVTRGQYVVCAAPGRAREYAELLDQAARAVHGYFARRGFQLPRLEFPLVVIISPTFEEFAGYAREEGFPVSPLLHGYYNPRTNRIAMYDADSPAARGTLVHEAVHQLAFNYGLHSRTGRNPRWVVEGLAMMLEVDGGRTVRGSGSTTLNVNRERLAHFREDRRHRRRRTIADLIADDEPLFKSAPLDAYGEAWALTYFLAETRPSDYFRYLKRIADRDPLAADATPQDRIEDFQAVFGQDLNRLEVQFLRYLDGLE